MAETTQQHGSTATCTQCEHIIVDLIEQLMLPGTKPRCHTLSDANQDAKTDLLRNAYVWTSSEPVCLPSPQVFHFATRLHVVGLFGPTLSQEKRWAM